MQVLSKTGADMRDEMLGHTTSYTISERVTTDDNSIIPDNISMPDVPVQRG